MAGWKKKTSRTMRVIVMMTMMSSWYLPGKRAVRWTCGMSFSALWSFSAKLLFNVLIDKQQQASTGAD